MAAEPSEAEAGRPCHGQVVARHHRTSTGRTMSHAPCGPNRGPQARIDFGCEKFDFAFFSLSLMYIIEPTSLWRLRPCSSLMACTRHAWCS
jgi:hypothetical protein